MSGYAEPSHIRSPDGKKILRPMFWVGCGDMMHEIYRDYHLLRLDHISAWLKSFDYGVKEPYGTVHPCYIEAQKIFTNYLEGASYWLQKKLSKQSTK